MATTHGSPDPSAWVVRFSPLVPDGPVLDVAAGGGRHTRWFADRGHPVVAVDRRVEALLPLASESVQVVRADLEEGAWPFEAERFAGVVVTNYLWRERLPELLGSVRPGGVLIYETFGVGNERFGKPSNPAFLLRPGELREACTDAFEVEAYEHLEVTEPKPAIVQRICAIRRCSSG